MENNYVSIGESLGIDNATQEGGQGGGQDGGTQGGAQGGEDVTEGAQGGVQSNAQGGTHGGEDGQSLDLNLPSIFESIIKESNPEFKVGEEVLKMKPEEQINFFKEELKNNIKPTIDDPFVQSYLDAKEKGLDPKTFIQQQNIIEQVKNLSSKDFLVYDLLRENGKSEDNPNGWEKSDVEGYLDGLSKIDLDLKAKERKGKFFQSVEKENEKIVEKQKEYIKTESEKFNNTVVKSSVEKLFSEMKDLKEIGGIPHAENDRQEFREVFEDLVQINPETGRPRTHELFNDDKTLYKVLYLYNKLNGSREGSLKSFLSEFKEKYKQEILDKTRMAPRSTGGSSGSVSVPKPGDFI